MTKHEDIAQLIADIKATEQAIKALRVGKAKRARRLDKRSLRLKELCA